MALLKGLTVTIDGDTRPLSAALKDAETASRSAARELKSINAALKLDPSNTVLLTQKQKVLGEQIAATRKKLDTLTLAGEQAQVALADGKGSEDALRSIQREIEMTKHKLSGLENQADKTGKALADSGKQGAEGQKKTKKEVKDVGDEATKSGGKVSSFGDTLKAVLASSAIIGAAKGLVNYIKQIGSAAKEQLDVLGDLDDNAQKVQMSAEALQEWQYAAKLSGMESETLVKALEKQQKSFASAKSGSASLAESYALLGLDVTQFESSEAMLTALIDRLADCEDETTRNAVASTIFGRSYAELAPLLNQGSKGVAALRQEARDLGIVISNDTVAAGAEAGDCLDRLNSVIDATKAKVVSGMLPGLSSVADRLRDGLNSKSAQQQLDKLGKSCGDLIVKAADLGSKLLPVLGDAISFVSRNGKQLVITLGAAVAAFKGFAIVNTAKKAIAGFRTIWQSLTLALSTNPIGAVITAIGALIAILSTADMVVGDAVDRQQELADAYRDAADAAEESARRRAETGRAMDDEMRHYDDLIAELDTLVDANGRVKEGQEARVNYIIGELSSATGDEITMVDGVVQKYNELTQSIRDSILMRQAESYLSSTKGDYDSAREQINSTATDEDGNYVAGSQAAAEQARQRAESLSATLERYNSLQTDLNAAVARMDSATSNADYTAASAMVDKLDGQIASMIDDLSRQGIAAGDLEELTAAAQEAQISAQYAYDQNKALIGQYDAVQQGVWSQDVQATTDALTLASTAMLDAQNASVTSLERQRDSALETYRQFKGWAAEDRTSVTTEQVRARGETAIQAATAVLEKMLADSDKYTQEQIDAAGNDVVTLLREVRGSSTAEIAQYLSELRQSADDSGDAFVEGLIKALQDGRPLVLAEVRRMGQGALGALNDVWDIHSPSRAAGRAAGYFAEGVRLRFDDEREPTLRAVRRYASDIRGTFAEDMSLPSMVAAAQRTYDAASASGGAQSMDAILGRMDRITQRLDEMDPTMVLDDGTLIARTDRALGETAAVRERGGLENV